MSTFTRPENALKKAEELIAVGQKETALQTLHDVITSKRHRTWSKTLESIMLKYVELCVEMRKGKVAKEGLHQYKLVCQQVNVSSLELVIKHFLALVEENAKEAQSKAEKLTLDIEDLDEEESAESIMLTAISGEATKDRTDREIVTPWLRFLWETYRTILEILRNNAKMEGVYHQTAEQAFSFCLRYQRKNEFRRLSDILRLHLANYSKYPNQPQNINLSVPETLQIHLDTRFSQLNVATELELWQEAFRSIEDIHSLIALSGRPAKPQMMATYFQKLAQIFWVSNNYTFHAYALYKYFAVARTVRNFTPEETRTVASTVLLSALSIPIADPKAPDDQYFEFDVQKEKNLRFCTLLTITSVPKREALLQDLIITKKINNLVVPGLPDLYDLLENKFQPLTLGAKMQEKFDILNANPALAQYVKPLQRLTFLRATQQLGTVYESMTIPDFLRIIKFMPLHEAEKNLVDLVKRKIVAVRIDHQNGALHFGNKQEQLRGQLITLAKDLKEVVKLINPEDLVQKQQKEKEKRAALIQLAKAEAEDRTWSYNRKFIIELKKQEAEKRMKQEQDRINEAKAAAAAAAAQATAARIEEERIEREKRLKEEQDKAKKADELQKEILVRGLAVPTAPEDITDVYIEKQLALLAKQKEAAEKKLQSVGKRLLYIERAKREVERPLLQAAYEKKKVEDQKFFDDNARQQAEYAQQQHTLQVAEKKRLSRMQADRAVFEERIMARRRADYEVRKAEQDKKLAEIKVKLEEDKKRKQQEAEERRAEEEKIRKAKEEEERKRREAEDLRRQEAEAQRKKQDEMIEKQRQREAEVMAKQRKEEEERREKERQARESARPPAREPEPWRRPGAGPRDDRDRPPPSRDERDEGGWRRPGAGRDELRDEGGWRRDGPPRRDEPPRDMRDSRDRPSFGDSRDRPPPRDDRDRDDGGWRRDGPPRRDDRDSRDSRPGFGDRDRPGFGDRDRPPPRDDRDRPSFRDDRDRPSFRDDRDRPPPRRDDDRDRPSFGDRDRPPPRDDRDRPSFRNDDRDRLPPRRDDDRPSFRNDDRDRPPPRDRDLRDNRDSRDRPPPPRGDDRDRRPPERGWSRDEPRKDDRAPPARRDSERDSEREKPAAPAPAKEPEEEKPTVDSDGFTTVPKGRRKK